MGVLAGASSAERPSTRLRESHTLTRLLRLLLWSSTALLPAPPPRGYYGRPPTADYYGPTPEGYYPPPSWPYYAPPGRTPGGWIAGLPPEDQPEANQTAELPTQFRRQVVNYVNTAPAGTIIVDTPHTFLYLVLGQIIMSPPSPLSALCTANEVAVVMEAGPRAESFVIVNGSDQRKSSTAVRCLRPWRSTGRFWPRRVMGPTTSNEGRRSNWRKRVA